jgi:REP element-mobilizing transposase RayT
MQFNPAIHHCRSIRLPGFDYGQPGAYFVTLCTRHRECLFGEVVNEEIQMNSLGQAVASCWNDLENHYGHVDLDAFVVMPNHVHGIIVLTQGTLATVGAGFKPAPTTPDIAKRHGLPEIVRAFKTFPSRGINQLRGTPGQPVWQRNYYEHVIRNEAELDRVRQYVHGNPGKWLEDTENPENLGN